MTQGSSTQQGGSLPVCGRCYDGLCENHEQDCSFGGVIPCDCPNATSQPPNPFDDLAANLERAAFRQMWLDADTDLDFEAWLDEDVSGSPTQQGGT